MYSINRNVKIRGFYSFFCSNYNEGYFFSGEHHPYWEIVYCLGGIVGVSSDEKIYRLHSGDIIVYPPNVHHKLWAEGASKVEVLVFSFKASGDILGRIGGAYSCDQYLIELLGEIVEDLKLCKDHRRTRGYLDYLEQSPVRMQLVANSCENVLLSLLNHGLPLGSNDSENARDYALIIKTMRQNIDKALKVEELSAQCNISVSSMKKLFCKFNSMGIHEYFLHLKMDEAIKLLKEGKTVMETAELLGFSNPSYFSTAFKRVTKQAPGHYKKK